MSSNLEPSYFLASKATRLRAAPTENLGVSRQGVEREIDAVEVVVVGGINVVPNHHHGHRAGGGSPPVWYQGGTVRSGSEVTHRA